MSRHPAIQVAADTLVERAETAHQWITSPLQSFTADAINMVRADRGYQRSDYRLQTIFRGIHTINELAHGTNPFSKALSVAALEQIDTHFKHILGELEYLESEVGSFEYTRRKYADQPLANPFRGTPLPRTSMSGTDNPFRLPAASPKREEVASVEPTFMPSVGSANPFRSSGDFSTDSPPPKAKPPQAARPPQTATSADPTVHYPDPATRELTTKRRSALPTSVTGDDQDGARCSADGLGIVTETCEQQRRAPSSKTGGATRERGHGDSRAAYRFFRPDRWPERTWQASTSQITLVAIRLVISAAS